LVTASWHVAGIGVEPLGGRMELAPVAGAAGFTPELISLDGKDDAVFAAPTSAWTENASTWDRVRSLAGRLWPYAFLGLWLAGAAIGLLHLLSVRFRLAHGLHVRREVAEGPVRLLLDRLCLHAGVTNRIRLTVSDRIGGPMAFGRAEICLPERALSDLGADQQRSVLAHELAHLVRRDPTWRWVSAIVERLFFFQPLNRIAKDGLRDSAEFLCDDWAVKRTGERLTLAKCLVEVAGWLQRPSRPLHASAMADRGSSLVHRVERLLAGGQKQELPGRWRVVVAAALLVAVSAGSPGVTAVTPDLQTPEESVAVTPKAFFMPAGTDVHTISVHRPAPPAPPSLIVVPEAAREEVVVFAVEAPLEPVRVRLERLVGELERLNTEINRIHLDTRARRFPTPTEHREALHRLFELKQRLEQTGTLRLEVWVPTKIEDVHERLRIKASKRLQRTGGRRLHLGATRVHSKHKTLREVDRELYRPSWI
jgi:beta-lactamase regulating signal transducer with metallopeptidase domain